MPATKRQKKPPDRPAEPGGTKRKRSKSKGKRPPDEKKPSAPPRPFWNQTSRELSWSLWLPERHAPPPLRGYADGPAPPGWFSVHTTVCPSSATDVWEGLWDIASERISRAEDERLKALNEKNSRKKPPRKRARKADAPEKPPAAKAIKIRLYPDAEERQKLLRWFGAARWTYNKCVELHRDYDVPLAKKALRAVAVNAEALASEPAGPDIMEVPYDVRDEGMNDLVKAYAAFRGNPDNSGKRFDPGFRALKRLHSESIVVHSKFWNLKRSAHYSFLHGIRTEEPLPGQGEARYDMRLTRKKSGKFYLCVPSPLSIASEKAPDIQGSPSEGEETGCGAGLRVVSIDPGIRTFATCYDPNGVVTEWGKADVRRFYRLCHAADDLQSRWSQPEVRAHRRWKMRRAALRIYDRIRNLVADLHRKLAKWLCSSHDVVLLPDFRTQGMVRRGQRRINSRTARSLCTWSHYTFRQRLMDKAREYPRCRVYIVDEAYTSKTCGRCGVLNHRLAGSKEFWCDACHLCCDRDHNGSRNILLRFLSSSPYPPSPPPPSGDLHGLPH